MQIQLQVNTQKRQKSKFITRIIKASENNVIEIHKLPQRTLNYQHWEVKPGGWVIHNNDVYTIKEVNFTDAKPSNLLLTLDREFPTETYEVHSLFIRTPLVTGDHQGDKIFLYVTPRDERRIDYDHCYLKRNDGTYFKIKSHTIEPTNPHYITAEVEELINPSAKQLNQILVPAFRESSKLYALTPEGRKEVF